MPVGMAIAMGLFPRERHGFAMAMWGMAALVGPALGPTLGGWLATSVSWHWLFLINVPIGAVAVVVGVWLIPNIGHRERRRFDVGGLILGSGGLSLLVLGLSEGNLWGWTSAATVTCLALGVGALVGFVPHELRADQPMLELRMFDRAGVPVERRRDALRLDRSVRPAGVHPPRTRERPGHSRPTRRAPVPPRSRSTGDRNANRRPARRPHRRPATDGGWELRCCSSRWPVMRRSP